MRFLILLGSIFVSSFSVGQAWKVGVACTYGTYSMASLKEFQNDLKSPLSFVPIKEVESFPPWFGYEVRVIQSLPKLELDYSFSFNSTGGRLHYADYSGEMKFDQLVIARTIGVAPLLKLNQDRPFIFFLGIKGGLSFSNLDLSNSITVNNEPVAVEEYTFKSLNFNLSPLLKYEYTIRQLFLFAEVRYEINVLKSKFTQEDDSYLELNNGEPLKADWDGLRLTAGIGYSFTKSLK